MPINIKDITIKNFQSFGNYETKLDLDSLGPVLIVGELEESSENKVKKSNGAGKSSLVKAIVWGLKGRTPERARPGDTVINYQTGKDCLVKITTIDGYVIERSRKFDKKDELLFYKIGDKDTTLSTNTAAQKEIDRIFKIDYDILSSTVFFEQKSKPILELPPKQRSQVLEKMLQLNKINYRADIAKEKLKSVTDEQDITNKELSILKDEFVRLELTLKETEEFKSRFEESRTNKIIEIDKRILSTKEEISHILLPDIDSIKAKWDIINKLEIKLSEKQKEYNELNLEISLSERNLKDYEKRIEEENQKLKKYESIDIKSIQISWENHNKTLFEIAALDAAFKDAEYNKKELNHKIDDLNSMINEWNKKTNTVCPACKQGVSHNHTSNLIEPYQKELRSNLERIKIITKDNINLKLDLDKKADLLSLNKPKIALEYIKNITSEIDLLKESIKKRTNDVKLTSTLIQSNSNILKTIGTTIDRIKNSIESKPEYSIREAEVIFKNKENLQKNIELLEYDKNATKVDANPYVSQISKIKENISSLSKKIEEINQKIKRYDILIKHYTYIRKAYYDKNKIKSFILNSMMPILNDRFRYYLDQFGFDNLKLEFNNLLQLESDKWDISMCSGGERQCMDLALMFALYDLNAIQYGRQCNIMILDEVDSRLDGYYVDAFASIIVDDFGKEGPTKPSTILTISHKNDLFDAFPTKIRVKKKDGFSRLEIEK